MSELAVIDMRELSVTPFFKVIEVENVHKSETAGYAVMETKEVVEVRIAGDKNYAPEFPAQAQWKRDGMRVITYAERWSDQYAAFKSGSDQDALGTPLEMLSPYGVTPEAISFCRALKIYSVEALAGLEGHKFKALGMRANSLKGAATKFMADRNGGVSAMAEIEALKAKIALLEGASTQAIPVEQVPAAEIEAYAGMTDVELKDAIGEKTGQRPLGNPSRKTLVQMATELEV